jgi:hypothetical protein
MLEAAVNFGLTGNAAGKIVNMAQCNTGRIINENKKAIAKEDEIMQTMPRQLHDQMLAHRRCVYDAAVLDALMAISKARANCQISNRNKRKID